MDRRLEIDAVFRSLVGGDHVYFQPPESVKLKYPCIIYSKVNLESIKAENTHYLVNDRFDVTLITEDPDDPLPKRLLLAFPLCKHNRCFPIDNLYHNTYTLY